MYDSAHPEPATLDEALGCFWAAVALRPDSAPAHYTLGNALGASGRLDEAIACYRKAIALDPGYAQAHTNLGVALKGKGRLDEAIACYRKAIEIDPKLAQAHTNLGVALKGKGRLDEAIACYRKAIEIDPKDAYAHTNLGSALRVRGRLEEAIAEYRKATEIDPKLAPAHANLGAALRAGGRLDEAIACYHKAIALDPKDAKACGALAEALLERGHFAEARAATRRCLELLPQGHPLRQAASRLLRQCERLLALDEKLSAVLRGEAEPADSPERLALAELCTRYKRRPVAAARFYADAFTAEPKLADDLRVPHRYNAACAAALAAAGKGEDAARLDKKERDRWRKQALDWLRADLHASTRLAEKGNPAARQAVAQRLAHWQKDPDLAAVRDKEGLDALPEADRQRWRQLWADAGALLKKATDKR